MWTMLSLEEYYVCSLCDICSICDYDDCCDPEEVKEASPFWTNTDTGNNFCNPCYKNYRREQRKEVK